MKSFHPALMQLQRACVSRVAARPFAAVIGLAAMLAVAASGAQPAQAQTAEQAPSAAVTEEAAVAPPSPAPSSAPAPLPMESPAPSVAPATAASTSTRTASADAPTTDRASKTPTTAAPRPDTECNACEDRNAPEGSGTFLLGIGMFDLTSLNNRLAANGYEKLDGLITVIGGEGRAIFHSGFVAGGHGAGFLSPGGGGPGNLRTSFGGGFGMLDLGFAPVHTQAVLFTMTGGIGGYGWSLGISDQQSAKFDDVLKNPMRSSSLGSGGMLVGLTLGIDGRIGIGEVKDGRRGFFTLGARVGGLYGPQLGSWGLSEEGMGATGGPHTGLLGAYAAVALGFGGGKVPAGAATNANGGVAP